MYQYRLRGISILHFLIQMGGILLILWTTYALVNWLRFDWELDSKVYVDATFVILLASVVEFLTRPVETRSLTGLSRHQLMTISQRQTLFALVAILGAMVMFKDDSLSRVFLTFFYASYFLWISWSNRFGFRMLHRRLYPNRQKGLLPTLLVGPTAAVRKFTENPRSVTPPGTEIQGFIPLGPDAMAMPLQYPILGTFSDLRNICEETRIKALLLLGLNDRKDLVPSVVKISNELGLRTAWINDVEEIYGSGSKAFHTDRYSVVSRVQEPLEDPINRVLKRILDLCGSAVGITLLLPPAMIFVAILHRLHSPGPLFYRQERTGRHGEVFRIFKFRSMNVSGDTTFVQAREGDTRIFKGGDFIRRYSIDELPQFLNVFTGQMTMVGPRPHPVSLDDMLAPDTHAYRLRNLAKPGITGLAQSRGFRGETREPRQIRNRLKLDLFYISHWSLGLDIRIIFETAWQLIRPPKSAL